MIERKNKTRFWFHRFQPLGGLPSFPKFSCVYMKHFKYKEINKVYRKIKLTIEGKASPKKRLINFKEM